MTIRQVNLVPPSMLFRRSIRRRLRFWAGCLILLLGVNAGYFLFEINGLKGRATAAAVLKEIDRSLGAQIRQIAQMQKELEDIVAQHSTFTSLTKHRLYSPILSRLSQLMHPRTWLAQLAIQKDKTQGETRFSLAGFSIGNEALGELLDRLSREETFREVVLQLAQEGGKAPKDGEEDPGRRLIQFRIEGTIVDG